MSNSLEALFLRLEKQVLGKKRSLFDLPLIAVASYGMKRWLKIEWAKRGVALGLKIVTLEEALEGKNASRYDLLLALFHLLQNLPEDPIFEPVKRYLNQQKGQKRLIQLAKMLARNFYLYGIYEGEIEGWQQKLMHLLKDQPYHLKFWNDDLKIKKSTKELHLFGFSYIPPLFFEHLIKKQSYFYLLSPCQVYWSDLPASPLLLSLGTLGREMAKQLDEKQVESDYLLPQEEFSLLQALKIDLLFNKDPQSGLVEDFPLDQSIEVHATPSIRREVEIVYYRLLHMAEHDPTFDPSQVLVLAKDISPYIPYIRAIFESETSKFDPLLFDQPKGEQNQSYQLFCDMIQFAKSRLEKHLYLKILREEPEKVELIREWIEQAEILWGYDAEHRNALLKEAGCRGEYGEDEGRGTWKRGFQILLQNLMVGKNPKAKDAENLGLWITQFESLYAHLLQLIQGEKTPQGWLDSLTAFIDFWIKGEEDEMAILKETLRQIMPKFPLQVSIPFDMVWNRIQDSMNQKENVLGDKRLHAVTFSSLFPNRALPKSVIFFMGAQNKDFPKHEEENSLNLLSKKIFFPTMLQQDTYAFLESILSTKKHLFISYQKEKGPSYVVTELLDYLDQHFTIEGEKTSTKIVYTHPQDSFDASYFTGKFPLSVQDEALFQAATQEKLKTPFLVSLGSKPQEADIELETLYSFAKDPLKTFYQKGLSLKLKDVEASKEELETFQMDTLAKYGTTTLLKAGAKTQAFQKANLPIQSFGQLAFRDVFQTEEKLSQYGTPKTLIFQRGAIDAKLSESLQIKAALQVKDVILSGKLTDVVDDGLLVDDSKDDFTAIVKAWPKLLVLGLIGHPTKLLFWKIQKEKEVEIVNPLMALETYIDYYLESIAKPNISHPKFVRLILEKSFDEAKKGLNQDIQSPYWSFFDLNLNETDFLHWKQRLKEVYQK